MNDSLKDSVKLKLEKTFLKHNVLLAYVFGSKAKAEDNKMSDVDIAVFLDKEPNLKEELSLRSSVSASLGTEKLDLVTLNNAPPFIKHVVATEGKLIYEKYKGLSKNFSTKTLAEYEDTKYIRSVYINSFKYRLQYAQ